MRKIDDFPMFSLATPIDTTYNVNLVTAGVYYSVHNIEHVIKKIKYFTGVDGTNVLDTWSGDVMVIFLDAHYQKEIDGSSQEYIR